MSDAKNSETNLQYIYANLEGSINKFNADIYSSPWAAFKDLYHGLQYYEELVSSCYAKNFITEIEHKLVMKVVKSFAVLAIPVAG